MTQKQDYIYRQIAGTYYARMRKQDKTTLSIIVNSASKTNVKATKDIAAIQQFCSLYFRETNGSFKIEQTGNTWGTRLFAVYEGAITHAFKKATKIQPWLDCEKEFFAANDMVIGGLFAYDKNIFNAGIARLIEIGSTDYDN